MIFSPRSISKTTHLSRFSTHFIRLHKYNTLKHYTVKAISSSQNPGKCYLYSLERALNAGEGLDGKLWNSGHFYAHVYPDLPIASSWHELFQKIASSASHIPTSIDGISEIKISTTDCTAQHMTSKQQQGQLLVRTIGAQCRSQNELHTIIKSYFTTSNTASKKSTTPGALLFVSGSHPARKLPFLTPFLQNSTSLLRNASLMRDQGDIPPSTLLWAVENPNLNSIERLQHKIHAGADTILTQPLFDRNASERWFTHLGSQFIDKNNTKYSSLISLNERKEDKKVRVLAGLPMVSSIRNLIFWLQLCDLATTPASESIIASFPQSDVYTSKEELKRAIWEWNADFTRWVMMI